ncbi:hypothetical protein ABXJ76_05145 [Methylobacter sp. G7]
MPSAHRSKLAVERSTRIDKNKSSALMVNNKLIDSQRFIYRITHPI